jgi:2-amino-4-hydroxy-6-hydroxymethyldihydropteridine diphosphokinase
MNIVFLNLGSNIDRVKNISAGLNELESTFGQLVCSSVYESEPVGFEGNCFFNLAVKIQSELSMLALSAELKRIEDLCGRLRGGPRFSSRTLDIDIVTFGELSGVFDGIELPRPELYYNGFVLCPMAELVPESIDTKTGLSYAQLWDVEKVQIEKKQKLWKVDFTQQRLKS